MGFEDAQISDKTISAGMNSAQTEMQDKMHDMHIPHNTIWENQINTVSLPLSRDILQPPKQ